MPLVLLGAAAGVESPSAAIEPAVRAGLVDISDGAPSQPVAIRHALQRDGIYAGTSATRRRELHARAVPLVDEAAAWSHRVASLDRPDEDLAGQLEQLAAEEAGRGHLPLAATHLLWASDVSPARAGRERRLLTAALHLMLAEEGRGLTLREAVDASGPSPLRSCVLGTMAFSAGQLREAELRFTEALASAEEEPGNAASDGDDRQPPGRPYTLLGDGRKVMEFARQALATGTLDAAAESQTRTLVAIGASQVAGPRPALAELRHLDADPAGVGPVHVDGLSFRGVFHLLAGDLSSAVADLTASIKMARRGATITLGLRAYSYLALAQYLSGAWDDVLLTSDQGFSAASIRPRRYELPLLHLASGCVPAGRGAKEDGEASRPDGGGGGRRPRLRPGAPVRGHGPGPGVPGVRRLRRHGRRSRLLAGRDRPRRPQPGVRSPVAASVGGGPAWLRTSGRSGRRHPTVARPGGRGQLPASGRGVVRGLAGRARSRPRAGGQSTNGAKTKPARTAPSTGPIFCWPMAAFCGAPASAASPSSACGGPTTCTPLCGRRRS